MRKIWLLSRVRYGLAIAPIIVCGALVATQQLSRPSATHLSQLAVATSAAEVLIAEIQVRGGVNAGDEFIELYNPGEVPVSLKNWKLEYLTSAGTPTDLVTFADQLAPQSSAVISKTAYVPAADMFFTKSLSDTGGHVRLVRADGSEVDRVGWGMAQQPERVAAPVPSKGESLARLLSSDGKLQDSDNNKADFVAGEPTPLPGGLEPLPIDQQPPPVEQIACGPIILSEVLANPEGADANGGEFIELYNPTATAQALANCVLQTDKMSSYAFEPGIEITPHGYYVVKLADKLLNSGGTVVWLTAEFEETVTYPAVSDNQAWALLDGQWQLTSLPTPGQSNAIANAAGVDTTAEEEPVHCPTGKYRNPETNRCKSLPAALPTTPCKVGQVRNPETNRCRTIVSSAAAASASKPCAAGWERNPATNRCRKITLVTAKTCPAGQERNPETNRCRKTSDGKLSSSGARVTEPTAVSPVRTGLLALAGVGVLGYAGYEYRTDIRNKWQQLLQRFRRQK